MIDERIIHLIHLLTEEKWVTFYEKEKIDKLINKLIKNIENIRGEDD